MKNDTKGFYSNTSSIRFLDKRIANLSSCNTFSFSVSFIKKAGLVLRYDAIKGALERGAKGRILTSTYQNFTDVPALERFLKLQKEYPHSFSCHLDFHCFGENGFHTKGYLFSFDDHKEILVGSSNITRFALLFNKEWDVSVVSNENEDFYQSIRKEFDSFWEQTLPLTLEVIKKYQTYLGTAIERWDRDYFDPENENIIKPNPRQRRALKEIQRYRDRGVNRALVVAATGSGKTYLAAFDALNRDSTRLLFIVHKDIILKAARKTFQTVFKESRTYGIYTAESKQLDADFLFASNQIRSENLDLFSKDEFDYIIIDEVHHASASTYQKIIQYFHPEFLLGLTATPERRDGQDVYSLFGNNVPYDLRLRDALVNDLIVPFHYYGIKDSLIDYSDNKSPEGIRRIIQGVSSLTNCEFIKENVLKYKPSMTKLRCVAFCKNKEHARLRARNRGEVGFHTAYLTSENTTGERIKVLNDLQDENNPLEMLFAVDILNEGVDVPSRNRVLFLRPTESPTIFIQQLGRGLRKYQGKAYLTVLDFIANSYNRSVQIALALGSLSKAGYADKRTRRNLVISDFSSLNIPGLRIHFDEESQKEILDSIEKTNLNSFAIIKQDYLNFKDYLKRTNTSRIPMPRDYLNNEVDADLLRFRHKSSFQSYYDFICKAENPDHYPLFDEKEIKAFDSLSYYLPLVRDREYLILKKLREGEQTKEELQNYCLSSSLHFKEESFLHALDNLQDKFFYTRPSSHIPLVKKENGFYQLDFSLKNPEFKRWVENLIEYGLTRYRSEFFDESNLVKLYYRYSVVSFSTALNSKQLYIRTGVFNTPNGRVITINLRKDSQIEERLKYKDKFLSTKVIQWESMPNTTRENNRGKQLLSGEKLHVLVRKTKRQDGQDRPYIYLGLATPTNPRPSDNVGKCLLFDLVLDKEIDESLKYDLGIEDLKE